MLYSFFKKIRNYFLTIYTFCRFLISFKINNNLKYNKTKQPGILLRIMKITFKMYKITKIKTSLRISIYQKMSIIIKSKT